MHLASDFLYRGLHSRQKDEIITGEGGYNAIIAAKTDGESKTDQR